MVDTHSIHRLLKEHFNITGTIHVDAETGLVDVEGSVELLGRPQQLPVQFGTVTQKFNCSGARLESLAGAPHTVGKEFTCSGNRLTSLEGGPQWVGGGYWCPNNQLTNLVGAPDHVGGTMSVEGNPLKSLDGMPSELRVGIWLQYQHHLPLLRLLTAPAFVLSYAPDPVITILNTYRGQGKKAAIKAAAELIKAGYKENARW